MLPTKLRILFGMFAVFALAAVFAAACGDDDDDNGGGNNGGNATATQSGAAAKKGGQITIVYPEPESFDPHYSSFAQDIGVQRMVFRGLFRIGLDNKPSPE